AAGELRNATGVACGGADQRRIALIGAMRREHVVVGGNDGEVRPRAVAQGRLVGSRSREAMGQVRAAMARAPGAQVPDCAHALQVVTSRAGTAPDDALGDRNNRWMHRNSSRAHTLHTERHHAGCPCSHACRRMTTWMLCKTSI